MSDPLYLDDIKNFEDLDEITTMASTDILPITDVSEPADNKVTVQTLAENLNKLGGTHVTVNDWSTYTTTEVPAAGQIIYFYNNSELGTDRRFHVTGDGSSTVAELDKCAYLEAGTEFILPDNKVSPIPTFTAFKFSDDILVASIRWPDLPKQDATQITIVPPSSGSLAFIDTSGNSYTINAQTVSCIIVGHDIYFDITQTGEFAGAATIGRFRQTGGTDGKLTLS